MTLLALFFMSHNPSMPVATHAIPMETMKNVADGDESYIIKKRNPVISSKMPEMMNIMNNMLRGFNPNPQSANPPQLS